MPPPADLAELKSNDFLSHLDEIFELHAAGGAVALKLLKVEQAGQSLRAGGAFSLLFMAPTGPWLPQAVYPVEHPALGTLEIFLVPIGPVAGGNGYYAVFT